MSPAAAPLDTLLTDPAAIGPAAPGIGARRSRAGALTLTGALIVLGLLWELWLVPTGHGTLALKVLPLVLAWRGLSRYRLYTYRWLSLAVWAYAAEGALRASSDAGVSRALASLELLLALALFGLCAWHVRARLADGRRATPPVATPT